MYNLKLKMEGAGEKGELGMSSTLSSKLRIEESPPQQHRPVLRESVLWMRSIAGKRLRSVKGRRVSLTSGKLIRCGSLWQYLTL
jgi:hypothetical protein